MNETTLLRTVQTAADAKWVAKILANPEIARAIGVRVSKRLGDEKAIALAAITNPGAIQLALVADERIGVVGFSDYDSEHLKANLWFARAPFSGQRRGSMTQAVIKACESVENSWELRTIYAWAISSNIASQNLLARADFQHFGTEPSGFQINGSSYDLLWYNKVLAPR